MKGGPTRTETKAMGEIEVRWEGQLPAAPQVAWDGFTRHAKGWLWEIVYEPREGGSEKGLTEGGGVVTVWEPHRRFVTRYEKPGEYNELEYLLEPRGDGTYLRYKHQTVLPDDEHEVQLDACIQHTAFYNHSLGEYLGHFPGQEAVYVSADAPEVSAKGGFAKVKKALGLPEDVSAGDRVRLTPEGLTPIEGVVDYSTPVFLGVRTASGLYRFYGRDAWGWPVGVAHHLFGAGDDETAWSRWLEGVFAEGKA